MSLDPSAIISGLVARGLPLHVAQGIAANMAAESRLDTRINEQRPLVPGSRGGFGLNQWTGPRRRAIEAAAVARGVPVDDLDFQLDYTLEELNGPEARAFAALQGATTAEEAARIYSEQFLRPGIPHMDRRLAYAREFAGMPPAPASGGTGAPTYAGAPAPTGGGQDPALNALAAAMQQQPQQPRRPENALAALDPRAFMQAPAPWQPMPFEIRNRLSESFS